MAQACFVFVLPQYLEHRQGSRCFANSFKDRSGATEEFESCRGQSGLTEHCVPLYRAWVSRFYLLLGFIFKPIVSPDTSCLWLLPLNGKASCQRQWEISSSGPACSHLPFRKCPRCRSVDVLQPWGLSSLIAQHPHLCWKWGSLLPWGWAKPVLLLEEGAESPFKERELSLKRVKRFYHPTVSCWFSSLPIICCLMTSRQRHWRVLFVITWHFTSARPVA